MCSMKQSGARRIAYGNAARSVELSGAVDALS